MRRQSAALCTPRIRKSGRGRFALRAEKTAPCSSRVAARSRSDWLGSYFSAVAKDSRCIVSAANNLRRLAGTESSGACGKRRLKACRARRKIRRAPCLLRWPRQFEGPGLPRSSEPCSYRWEKARRQAHPRFFPSSPIGPVCYRASPRCFEILRQWLPQWPSGRLHQNVNALKGESPDERNKPSPPVCKLASTYTRDPGKKSATLVIGHHST